MTSTRVRRGRDRNRGLEIVTGLVPFGLIVFLSFNDGSLALVPTQQASVALWAAIALGVAFGFLPRARVDEGLRIPLIGLGLMITWAGLGLIWAEGVEVTLDELNRLVLYAGVVVGGLTLVSARSWKAVALGLGAGMIAVCLAALVSRLGPGLLPSGQLDAAFGGRRLAYPIDYWNGLGAIGMLSIALCWGGGLQGSSRTLRGLALGATPIAVSVVYLSFSRAAAGLSLLVLIAMALLSMSRSQGRMAAPVGVRLGAVLGGSALVIGVIRSQAQIADGSGQDGAVVVAVAMLLACVMAGMAGASSRRLGRPKGGLGPLGAPRATNGGRSSMPSKPSVVALAVVAVVAVGSIVAVGLSPGASELPSGEDPRFASDPGARLISFEDNRTVYWRSALEAFAEHPVAGLDAGAFRFWWSREGEASDVRDAHSLYLESLAEQGLPGLIATVLFLWGLLVIGIRGLREQGLRRSDEHLIASAAVGGTAFLLFVGVDWVFELSSVAVAGLITLLIPVVARSRPIPRGRRFDGGRAALLVMAIAAIGLQVPGLVSGERILAAEDALARGSLGGAQANSNDAIRAEPWSADAHAIRAKTLLLGGRLDAARKDALRAIDREPRDWRLWALLAQIEAEAGRDGAVRLALEELAERKPSLQALATQLSRNPRGLLLNR